MFAHHLVMKPACSYLSLLSSDKGNAKEIIHSTAIMPTLSCMLVAVYDLISALALGKTMPSD